MLSKDYILGALHTLEGVLSAINIIERQTNKPENVLNRLEETITGTIEELNDKMEDAII